eukprot:5587925-Pleurochrysis_carterae.AAC.2
MRTCPKSHERTHTRAEAVAPLLTRARSALIALTRARLSELGRGEPSRQAAFRVACGPQTPVSAHVLPAHAPERHSTKGRHVQPRADWPHPAQLAVLAQQRSKQANLPHGERTALGEIDRFGMLQAAHVEDAAVDGKPLQVRHLAHKPHQQHGRHAGRSDR